ncbi:MAG: hypothetical protein ACXVOI_10835 [Tumebacillaceae bacterium]
MNETVIQVEGVLVTDPFPYQSIEEREEIYLAKFQPTTPLQVAETELVEVYLNFGTAMPELLEGARVEATGVLTERKMVTRSGKVRRGGIFQLLIQDWKR